MKRMIHREPCASLYQVRMSCVGQARGGLAAGGLRRRRDAVIMVVPVSDLLRPRVRVRRRRRRLE